MIPDPDATVPAPSKVPNSRAHPSAGQRCTHNEYSPVAPASLMVASIVYVPAANNRCRNDALVEGLPRLSKLVFPSATTVPDPSMLRPDNTTT